MRSIGVAWCCEQAPHPAIVNKRFTPMMSQAKHRIVLHKPKLTHLCRRIIQHLPKGLSAAQYRRASLCDVHESILEWCKSAGGLPVVVCTVHFDGFLSSTSSTSFRLGQVLTRIDRRQHCPVSTSEIYSPVLDHPKRRIERHSSERHLIMLILDARLGRENTQKSFHREIFRLFLATITSRFRATSKRHRARLRLDYPYGLECQRLIGSVI